MHTSPVLGSRTRLSNLRSRFRRPCAQAADARAERTRDRGDGCGIESPGADLGLQRLIPDAAAEHEAAAALQAEGDRRRDRDLREREPVHGTPQSARGTGVPFLDRQVGGEPDGAATAAPQWFARFVEQQDAAFAHGVGLAARAEVPEPAGLGAPSFRHERVPAGPRRTAAERDQCVRPPAMRREVEFARERRRQRRSGVRIRLQQCTGHRVAGAAVEFAAEERQRRGPAWQRGDATVPHRGQVEQYQRTIGQDEQVARVQVGGQHALVVDRAQQGARALQDRASGGEHERYG
jgi:hypothetical protein